MSSRRSCPKVWACATTDMLMICYGHYHTCHLSAHHQGECQSGTGADHNSSMRHGEIVTSVAEIHAIIASASGSRPSWLDDHRAQELGTFRARFTDQAWALFRAGLCSHLDVDLDEETARYCGVSRRHGRVLCDRHVREVRQGGDFEPHRTSVPTSVASMDISEVP